MKTGSTRASSMVWVVTALLLCSSVSAQTPAPKLFIKLPGGGTADQVIRPKVDAIKAREDTQSVALFTLDLRALKGARAEIALADAPPVVASRDSFEEDPKNSKKYVWTGSLAALPGVATFAVNDGKMQGTIRKGLDLYRVETVENGIHAIIKIDQQKFPKQDEPPSQSDRTGKKPANRAQDGPPQSKLQSPVIDVLVAYTANAKAASGDIDALISVAVAESNRSFQNSNIRMKLNLIATMPFDNYTEPADFDQILDDFVARPSVKQRMVASGADIAILIMNNRSYCGLAKEIGASADTAFAIVHYNCATGYYSFAHEIGHLLGARHDPDNDPEPGDQHGFQNPGAKGWRTIMAYNCAGGCSRLMYWSSPNILYPAGGPDAVPMGISGESNNARVLNISAGIVANFRTSNSTNVARSR